MSPKQYITVGTRAEFGWKEFRPYYGNYVVDIGAGGSATFYKTLLGNNYIAVDATSDRAKPDVVANFERLPLPFKDNSFESVLCFDCLEHCDNIHALFDELVRISSRYVILSLPNNWPGFLTSLLYGHNCTHTTGYGLPVDQPDRGIRHKWWFNMEEAERFVLHRAQKNDVRVAELRYIYEPGDALIHLLGFYPKIMQVRPDQIRHLLEVAPQRVRKHGYLAWTAYRLARWSGEKWLYPIFLALRYGLGLPLSVIDEVLKRLTWGWGGRYRYLNLFCRQLWVVLEKPILQPSLVDHSQSSQSCGTIKS